MRKQRLWCVLVLFFAGVTPARGSDPVPAASKAELEALKTQLAAQQQQLQELQELLRQQGAQLDLLRQQLAQQMDGNDPPAIAAPAQAVAPEPGDLAKKVDAVAEQTAELNTLVGDVQNAVKGLGNFSFSGDLRVRYEPFLQDGAPQRHRERARLRFQVRANISEELSGGFRLATGGLEDPISSVQSFTGFFTRKAVDLDQFWITYKPSRARWLTVTAGKFAYPWYHTELTFDNDLNPEGFSETVSFNFTDSPLANVTLVGFQLPFNELADAGDSFIWGGQVQTQWKLSERLRLGLYAAGMNFRNADAIARAMATGVVRPSLPLSNRVRLNGSGNVIGFAERFAYLNLIAELNYRLARRWPVRLTLDFVNNIRAAGNERSGYWAELAVGRTEEKGDWLFGYTFIRTEQDAVIGAYSFSDLRASTNILNHRLRAGYQIHKNVVFDYTLFIGRLFNPQENLNLVPVPFRPLGEDPFLHRMQFDVVYKF